MLKIKDGYEFYCVDDSIYELNKVVPIKKYKTNWRIPRNKNIVDKHDQSFSHLCSGIRTLARTGWVLSNFADINIKLKPNDDTEIVVQWPQWYKHNEERGIKFFTPEEFSDMVPVLEGTNKSLVKLSTPWNVKCPKGWGLTYLPLQYHGEQTFYSSTGILDPEICQELNIIMFVHPRKDQHSVHIPANTPLVHLIPVPLDYDKAEYRKATEKEKKWEELRNNFIRTRFTLHPKNVKELYKTFFKRR